jgi:hypothetical protein
LQINAGLLDTIDAVISTVQPSPDRPLESLIRFNDVISNHVTVDDTLMSVLQLSGVFEKVYLSAREYVHANRPLNETIFFDELFPSRLPRDCFI